MTDKKKPEIVFQPGCFDMFDGTQEDLEELMAAIQSAAETGDFFEDAHELSEEDWEELPDEVKEHIMRTLDGSSASPRKLQ